MYLFFDTETNGLPKNYKGDPRDLDNWPRVIQLAWQLYDNNGQLHAEACDLIKPDGWVIPNEKFWIDNGYSTEKSMAQGVPMAHALNGFVAAINQCDMMVAHNLDFDNPILTAEMIRYGLKADKRPQKFCTMKSTTAVLRLPGKFGLKWPNLTELHNFCFGRGFDGAHDALADVKACASCFFHLNSHNLITLPTAL